MRRKPYVSQKCLLLKGGLRMWLTLDQAKAVAEEMSRAAAGGKSFVVVDGSMVSVGEMVGLLDPSVIDDDMERWKGSWTCGLTGAWHGKGRECDCGDRIALDLGRTSQVGQIPVTWDEYLALGGTASAPEVIAKLKEMRGGRSDAEMWRDLMRRREEGSGPVAIGPAEVQ